MARPQLGGTPVAPTTLDYDDVAAAGTSGVDAALADHRHGMPSAGSGAPVGADYLVGTADGILTNEIIVGATPGGELGGTWGSPTVDATHSGSPHTNIPTQTANLDMGGNHVVNATLGDWGVANSEAAYVNYLSMQFEGGTPAVSSYMDVYRFGAGGGTVLDGYSLWEIEFYGNDGTSSVAGAAIDIRVDGTVSTGVVPTEMVFSTAESGSWDFRWRISPAGNFEPMTDATYEIGSFDKAVLSVVSNYVYVTQETTYGPPEIGLTSSDYTGLNDLGGITWFATADMWAAANIRAVGEAVPASMDVPTSLIFATTADGGFTTTDHWRLDSNGAWRPETDGAVDIGLTGTRVRVGYFDALAGFELQGDITPDGDWTRSLGSAVANFGAAYLYWIESLGESNVAIAGGGVGVSKSRVGATALVDGDTQSWFGSNGHDGTGFIDAAWLETFVDGTVATNDMPTGFRFWTNRGAAASTEAWLVRSSGDFEPFTDDDVNVGSATKRPATVYAKNLNASGTITGIGVTDVGLPSAPSGDLGGTWAATTVDATHSGSAHHTKYLDSEAVTAMGVKGDSNALHHDRYTDGEATTQADASVATHAGLSDPHTGYVRESATPGGELGGTYASPTVDTTHSGSAHHAKYLDSEAVSAMGAKGDSNALHHDRYADGDVDTIVATHAAITTAHHTKYTDAEATTQADASVATHAGLSDPHTGYLRESVVSGFATPALTLGTSNAAGSGTTGIRSGASIALFDTTNPDSITFGQSAGTGSATKAARRDHSHAMAANPVTAHEAASDPHTGYVREAATPGGELGGTYASPTVDSTHSGSAHHTSHSLSDVGLPSAPSGQLGGTWAATTVDASHSGSTHHTKYTNAEAIAAVEGEATLALSGQITTVDKISMLSSGDIDMNTGDVLDGANGWFSYSVRTDRVYAPGANLYTGVSGSVLMQLSASGLYPYATSSPMDLGLPTRKWQDLNLSGTANLTNLDVSGTVTGIGVTDVGLPSAPSGDLGGTWAATTVDAGHSGSAHSNLPTQVSDLNMGTYLLISNEFDDSFMSSMGSGEHGLYYSDDGGYRSLDSLGRKNWLGPAAHVTRSNTSDWGIGNLNNEYTGNHKNFATTTDTSPAYAAYFDVSTNTGEIRVRKAGVYMSIGSVEWNSSGGSSGRLQLTPYTNAAIQSKTGNTTPMTTHGYRQNFCWVDTYAANADLGMGVLQNSGGTMTITNFQLTVILIALS